MSIMSTEKPVGGDDDPAYDLRVRIDQRCDVVVVIGTDHADEFCREFGLRLCSHQQFIGFRRKQDYGSRVTFGFKDMSERQRLLLHDLALQIAVDLQITIEVEVQRRLLPSQMAAAS